MGELDLKPLGTLTISSFRALFIPFLCIFALAAHPASATQGKLPTDTTERLAQWGEVVATAQERLARSRSDDLKKELADLEAIRGQLAMQRDRALAASRTEPFEATVAQGKLDLLGGVPETGESEFAAERRKELEETVYRLRAVQRAYEDSYLRSVAAIALIDERIDGLSRARILRRAGTPLWPGSWVAFYRESASKLDQLVESAPAAARARESGDTTAVQAVILVVLILGLLTLFLARRTVGRRLGARAQLAETERKFIAFAIAKDFTSLLVAAMGLALITVSVLLLTGVSTSFGAVPVAIIAIGSPVIIAHWLGLTLFAPRYPRLRFINLDGRGAHRAVWLMLALGLAVGLEELLETVEEASPYTESAAGAGAFMMLAILSASLYLLAKTIDRYQQRTPSDASEMDGPNGAEFINREIDWPQLVTLAMKGAAAVALGLAVVGYAELARWVIIPLIATLFLIAFFLVAYSRAVRLVRAYFLPYARNGDKSLLSIQFALLLAVTLAVVPLVALIWGVRPAELSDFIILLRDGVTVGGVTISLGIVLIFVAVFVLGYIITRWVQRLLQTALLARIDMDDGTRSAVVTGVGYVGIMLAFVAAIGAAGIDLSNLAIIFGALSVGIGFGMQSVVSNFVSGIIMLIERPIKEGDSIVVGDYAGIVDKISVRATRIQSFDHDDVIIPNSELITGTVRNRTLTDRMTRIECAVGIAYDADVNAAFDAIYEVANEHPRTVQEPSPNVVMEQLGDSALLLRLYCFIDEVGQALTTKSEMYVRIVEKFRERGIVIPFPQREISVLKQTTGPKQNDRSAVGPV